MSGARPGGNGDQDADPLAGEEDRQHRMAHGAARPATCVLPPLPRSSSGHEVSWNARMQSWSRQTRRPRPTSRPLAPAGTLGETGNHLKVPREASHGSVGDSAFCGKAPDLTHENYPGNAQYHLQVSAPWSTAKQERKGACRGAPRHVAAGLPACDKRRMGLWAIGETSPQGYPTDLPSRIACVAQIASTLRGT